MLDQTPALEASQGASQRHAVGRHRSPYGRLGLTAGLLTIAIALAAAQQPGGAEELTDAGEELVARGQALFEAKCAICHGFRGDGLGPASYYLSPKPRDLTSGVFKLKSTPMGSAPTDTDLFRTISHGIPGTSMPSWGHLSTDSRAALVAYIRTLSDRFDEEEDPEDLLIVGPEPSMTVDSIVGGRYVYQRLQCAQCHGETGRGDGPAAVDLKDSWGDPIRPRDFTKGPANMRTGGAPGQLYRAIVLGLEGTPMPAWGPMISKKDGWDLVHYIMSLREPPAEFGPTDQLPLEIPTLPAPEERGREYFKRFGCVACHGIGADGGQPNPNAATAEQIPGLTFVGEGYTATELAERIQRGQPEIAKLDPEGPLPPVYMPGWGSVLSQEQVRDITVYLFSLLPEDAGADW